MGNVSVAFGANTIKRKIGLRSLQYILGLLRE